MNLYIWGTGCGAGQAIQNGIPLSQITAFIETSPVSTEFLERPVLPPEKISSPDLIVVTTRHADQILKTCHALEIPPEKLLFLKDSCGLVNRNQACTAGERVLGKELMEKLFSRQYLITEPECLKSRILNPENDYIRLSVLELLSRQLQKVPGAAAELGVYKGAFAACMSKVLPDRKIYLFDSFQGFLPQEGESEKGRHTCTDAFLAAHENTSLKAVLQRMPDPAQVIPVAGYFPESLQGLEDRFCLVSLDADFRDSTLEGLRYFYPRLNSGGYLMLHDWGSPSLTGVREALEIFRGEWDGFIPSVPIPDLGGSLIIQKI